MDNSIVLIIDNETPIPAADLGELFSAFARDYRDLSRGRTLMVVRLEQGSTFIEWTDAIFTSAGHYLKGIAEAAKAIKSLADLALTLKSLFGKHEKPKSPTAGRKRKKPGDRTAEAIAKIAAENGCGVRLKHTSSDGETLEFE